MVASSRFAKRVFSYGTGEEITDALKSVLDLLSCFAIYLSVFAWMPAPSLRRSESFLNVRLRAIIIIVYINRFHHQSCQDTAVCNTFK